MLLKQSPVFSLHLLVRDAQGQMASKPQISASVTGRKRPLLRGPTLPVSRSALLT